MEAVSTQTPDPTELDRAVSTLFLNGGNSFTLANGTVIEVKEAGLRQIKAITSFFNVVANALTPADIAQLIDLVVGQQTKAIKAGGDPNKIDLASMATEDLVRMAMTNVSTATTALGAVLDGLPALMATFCNLTQEEIEDQPLEVQEAIIFGIFTVNYAFFTRRLRPIFQEYAKSWASENQGKMHIVSKIIQKNVKK